MDGYYDACLGYWQSAPRRNSFNFSLPFTTDVTASLHYKAGDKIENPTQVTGKKIGNYFRFPNFFLTLSLQSCLWIYFLSLLLFLNPYIKNNFIHSGFVGGWPISKKCFEHQSGFVGNSPGKYEAVVYEDHDLLVAAVNSGEVRKIFQITFNSYFIWGYTAPD